MLRLEVEKSANVTVLRCWGRVVRGGGADSLRRAVMAEDKCHILIDLNGVTAIDAAGLGVLAELARWAKDGCRTLHLANPSRAVRDLLEVTELNSVLEIVPDKANHHAA